MKRHEWEFPSTAAKLAEAAVTKAEHHKQREDWWIQKKVETMAKIRDRGLSVDESLVEAESAKFSSYARGPSVSVRDEFLRDLNECILKIREHHGKCRDYRGWHEVFVSQGERALSLHHDDWLFFFSQA